MKKLILSIMMSFMAISIALGQQTITGNVSGENGVALVGASVVEVGTIMVWLLILMVILPSP